MKIALGADQLLYRVKGGIASYTSNLIQNLGRYDELSITAFHSKGQLDLKNKQNLHDIEIPYDRKLLSFCWQFFRRPYIDNYVNGIDLVHALSFQIPPVRKCPLIVTVHDISFLIHPEVFPFYGKRYHIKGLNNLVKEADYIISVSESTKKDIVKFTRFPPEKIKVIYQGYKNITSDQKDVRSVLKKYNLAFPYLLYVGTIEPRKNLKLLLNAFTIIKEKNNDLRLVIVGPQGWLYEEIVKEIDKNSKNIIMLGELHQSELKSIYSSAELFIYPSIYEGFGFPPLEAMSNGCPVMVCNTSSLPEVVGGAGIYFNPDDAAELAGKIEGFLLDDNLRKEMVIKGKEQAARFTWERCTKQTVELYKKILGE